MITSLEIYAIAKLEIERQMDRELEGSGPTTTRVTSHQSIVTRARQRVSTALGRARRPWPATPAPGVAAAHSD